ncbi:MAG: phosphoenolpyruvate--protein phosphotransferase [Candidatus Cloacimonetes bacterium]|jgi:phosphotransferase system enzyme I (PtsI)|nr:phosphoenolpyruvate--protein phosphotransferase [Candidatus Cloacimonadota bacterium]MDD4156291.1 phosphoenolpyruvate--protein phosphotransferase [Candidatus Cloacimonadota bacterium]
MYKIKGFPVSTGIAIGDAKIIKEKALVIEDFNINESQIDDELDKFHKSINAVIAEIEEFITNFNITNEDESIIETHKMILQDPDFHDTIKNLIIKERKNLEQAIYLHFTRTIEYFKNLDNELYAERAIDYEDVYRRLIMHLKKIDNSILDNLSENDILIMNDIPPSLVSLVYQRKIQGLVLFKGTKTSHSVIIARALGLPLITGVKYPHKIHHLDKIIIDAQQGFIIGNPTQEVIKAYTKLKTDIIKENSELNTIKDLQTKTSNASSIKLLSNIELPIEIEHVLDLNSDGIGLFRTEFFYLNKQHLPTEEEQFNEYKNIALKLKNKIFVIRTIDIGGDKVAGWYSPDRETNPYLGCRGIRFSLRYTGIFKTQLRAILRASIFGNIQIMFPMISSIEEFLKAKEILDECCEELKNENKDFNQNIPIGTMIEIPSAAICSDALAKYCDFFSIGSNDLLQYTVAVDRNNESVSKYYTNYNPAFLQLITTTVKNAIKNNIPVAVCGEIASDKNFTAFLLNSGIKELSVGAEHSLSLKKYIRSIDSKKANLFIDEIYNCYTIEDSKNLINKINNISLFNEGGLNEFNA